MENTKNEKIILAAQTVFLRYGYKRVTMSDIAEAAKISRPAIYLAFQNKEEIFKSVIQYSALKNLNDIRQGITRFTSLTDQLFYAFELWVVRSFEVIEKSPVAEELLLAGHGFCKPIMQEIGLAFEAELTKVLRHHSKPKKSFSTPKIAHMMRCAVRGFKETAESSAELKQMIKMLIRMVVEE